MVKAVVMAAGQSLYDEDVIEKIKLYCLSEVEDIIILSADRNLKYVLESGLIPDYTCVNENIIRPPDVAYMPNYDFLPDFFYHGIIKSYASQITLYHNSMLTPERVKILEDMGFKTVQFNRVGCGVNKGILVNTGGNCGMALVQIARHILKIDKIGIIGLDLDNTTSYKNIDPSHELWHTKNIIVDDFLTMGKSVYNLTRMGNVHGKGIIETNIDDFLK